MQNFVDELYYDIILTNNINNYNKPINAYYNETRSIPLIYDTTDYHMSIIRFTLDTNTLPVFIPIIQTGSTQTNINLTIYSITLQYNDISSQSFYSQQYVIYQPQDLTSVIPSAPSSNSPTYSQVNTTGYYFVYNYTYFINLINTAFNQSMASVASQCDQLNIELPTTNAPYISFDSQTQLCTLNIPSEYYDSPNGNFKIYFNQALYGLFSSFPAYVNSLTDTNGKNFEIQYGWNGSNTTTITQEYSTISTWNPIMSIAFTSNLLPIISNALGTPTIYNENIKISGNNSNANTLSIISDMIADNFFFKPNLIYNPSAQYRYISLVPNQRINDIDISVYWLDRYQNAYPVLLGCNSSFTMKILFCKKILLVDKI